MPGRWFVYCAVQPPSDEMMPLVVTRLATLFGFAGMRQEPPVVSQMPHVTRLAATDAPAPPLEKPGERSVLYGVQAAPPQVARAASVGGKNSFFGASGPESLVFVTIEAMVLPKMIAPLSRRRATSVESVGGASMAKATSLPPAERMSFASYQSLTEKATQYMGIASKSGALPNCASSSAARSSASGCCRNASHSGGASSGSAPSATALSYSPRHVTERSPRILSVSSAFTCPAFGMPVITPICCITSGFETEPSILPRSSGGPAYWSRSGSISLTATVSVGKLIAAPARTYPVEGSLAAPSAVTSRVHGPL